MRELQHISPFLSSSSSLFFCWGWRNFSTAAVENVYSFEWGVSVTFRTRVFCPTKKTTKKWKRRKKCFFWLLLGCLGKYLEISRHDKLIMGEVSDTSFFTFWCSQIHTHAHTIYYSNKNAIFTVSRNDHDSRRRRHGAFYSYFAFVFVFVFGVVFREERVLCLWISLIDRDGLKTNSPNQRTSFCLSLFLGRRRALWRPTTKIIQTRKFLWFSIVYG